MVFWVFHLIPNLIHSLGLWLQIIKQELLLLLAFELFLDGFVSGPILLPLDSKQQSLSLCFVYVQHWSTSSLMHFISDSLYLEEPCKVRCECLLLPNDSIDLCCLPKHLLFEILTQLINGDLKFAVILLCVWIIHIFGLVHSFREVYRSHLKY